MKSEALRPAQQVAMLLRAAEGMEHGPARIATLQQAVEQADLHQDEALAYEARMALIEATNFGGRGELIFPAFSWCLSKFDRDPESYDEYQLLWRMKWIVGEAPNFPEIKYNEIYELLKDLDRRFRRYGTNRHAYYQLAHSVAWQMGDRRRAARYYAQCQRTPRDLLSDCPACVADGEVDYLLGREQLDAALERAEPIFRGQLRCMTVPHRTYPRVLLPLLKAGRAPEAMAYHHAGYRLVRRNPHFVSSWGEHFAFLALTGNLAAALRAIERHLPAAWNSTSVWAQMFFFGSAALAMQALERQGKTAVRLRTPAGFPLGEPVVARPTRDWADWFMEQARARAVRFDERNGNRNQQRWLREQGRYLKHITSLPERKGG